MFRTLITFWLIVTADCGFGYTSPRKLFPGGIVPYTVDSAFSDAFKTTISETMAEIQENTCIVFQPANVGEKDVVNIVRNNDPNGYPCHFTDAANGNRGGIIRLSNLFSW